MNKKWIKTRGRKEEEDQFMLQKRNAMQCNAMQCFLCIFASRYQVLTMKRRRGLVMRNQVIRPGWILFLWNICVDHDDVPVVYQNKMRKSVERLGI